MEKTCNYITTFFVILLYTFICNRTHAQVVTTTSKKVMHIYKFAENIKWNNEKKLKDFKIGVFSDDEDFFNELRILETIDVKLKNISVIRIKEIDDIKNVRLLVMTKEKNHLIKKISSKITEKNTLLVSSRCKKAEFIMINFIYSNDKKLDFEINKGNILKENFKIMPNLLLLGGFEIDIAELYKESQKSLERVNKRVKGLENELINKKKEIAKRNKEILIQKKEIANHKAKLENQFKQINNQLITISMQKENLLINSLNLIEQYKLLSSKINEIKQQEFEFIASRKILKNLNDEIDKKQKEIENQKDDIINYESTVEEQQIYILFAVAFSALVLVLVFFIWRGLLIKKKTAKKIAEKEAEIRMLFDIAPLPIIMTSIATKKARYINKLGEKLFKLLPGKALEEVSTDYYVNPEQQKEVVNILRTKGKISNLEVLFKNSKNEPFDALLSGRITKYNNEDVFFVTINDITERTKYLNEIKKKNIKLEEQAIAIKLTNKRLTESEEELKQNSEELVAINDKLVEKEAETRTLFDIAPFPIAMVDTEKRLIRYLNQKGKELFKLSSQDAINQNSDDFYIYPEHLANVLDKLQKHGQVNDVEVLLRNTENEHIYCSLSGLITVYNREVVYFVALNDITERIKYLEEIKDKNIKLKDQTEKIIFTNKQLITSEEELRQKGEELTVINKKLAFQKDELAKTIENLRETQSQLIQSEKMASLGVLTAGIAHEINNPVTFINAGIVSLALNINEFTEILNLSDEITVDNAKDKLKQLNELKVKHAYEILMPETQKLIGSIKDGTDRVTHIVKGLRTFSRLDEDDLKFADIHEGIDSTLIMLHSRYKNKIEIIKNYGKISRIECYPGKLNQVFMNVLSNSIDAITDTGKIWISTSYEIDKGEKASKNLNNIVVISIKDSGKGMHEDLKSKIFQPFFTTKDVGAGTGLGLSISHGIIKKHNGSIEVNCSLKGCTEFIIKLPAKQSNVDKLLN